MFRKMRRFNQQLSLSESIEILEKGKTGVLAVLGDNGYPYAVPLNYVYENGKIYFHCAKAGHKISALQNCEKVSFCVIDKDDVSAEEITTYFRSVIVFGKAEILTEKEDIMKAARILGLKYCKNADFIDREIRHFMSTLCCVKISVEHMTGKQAKELVPKTEF